MIFVKLGTIPLGIIPRSKPINFQSTKSGKRIVYGTANGIVSRSLPDQADSKSCVIETYLGSQCPIEVATVSSDDRLKAGGNNNGTVYIWNSSKVEVELTSHELGMKFVEIADMAFNKDSQILVIVGRDSFSQKLGVCIEPESGKCLGILNGHTKGINSVAISSKSTTLIATGGLDGRLCLHSGSSCNLIKSTQVGSILNSINCVRFSPNGEQLISCDNDGNVHVWSLRNGEVDRTINVSDSALFSLAWSVDSTRCAVVGADKRIRIILLDNGAVVDEIVLCAALPETPVGVVWARTDWIVTATDKGNIWGLKTNNLKFVNDNFFTWKGLYSYPTTVALNQQETSEAIVIGDSIGKLLMLNGDGSEPRVITTLTLPTPALIVSMTSIDGLTALVSHDRTLWIFNVPQLKNLQKATRIIRGYNAIRKYESESIDSEKDLKLPPGVGQSLIKSVKSQMGGQGFVTAAGEAPAYPPANVEWVSRSQLEDAPVAIRAIDQGSLLLVLCQSGNLYAYPFKSAGNMAKTVWTTQVQGLIQSVASTPDGSLLAIALSPKSNYNHSEFNPQNHPCIIEFYEVEDDTLEGFKFSCAYDLHESEITAIALNSAGTHLASADVDRNIRVVEIETGQKIITDQWNLHSDKITALAWSSDGLKLASCSKDGNVNICDIKTRKVCKSINQAHSGGVTCVEFILNNVVVTGGLDGLINCYELISEEEATA